MISRRDFLKNGSVFLAALSTPGFGKKLFEPLVIVGNPLASYPNRGWEKIYRDIYKPDETTVILCNPNDTHGCYLNAYVKNGIITRLEPTYKYGDATDIYGIKASHRWEPRCCNKGLALVRRFYGDRRIRGPFVRKGYYEWYKADFPRDENGKPPSKYFINRGKDEWLKVSWEEVSDIIAKSLINIAKTYSGEKGKAYLKAQGYPEEMIDTMAGAGTRTLKFRGSMPWLAVLRYVGQYRMSNMMALLDSNIRKVEPDKALGGVGWDNYSEHTDLPPAHTLVTGQQTVDFDLVTWEHAKLIVLWGMNPYGTKMPDSHWLTEAQIKGIKVIVISNDFMATARTADKVVITRTATDGALALSMAYVIMKEKLYDENFVKSFTDLPLLVRMDNAKLLRASDIIPNYIPKALNQAVVYNPSKQMPPPPMKQEKQYIPIQLRDQDINDFVVWDVKTNSPKVVTRDEVGKYFDMSSLDPALTGEYEVELVNGEKVKVKPNFQAYIELLEENYTPETVEEITGVPANVIRELALEIANHKGTTKITTGMGVNQYFHGDLIVRAIFLVAALTGNVGRESGNIGSYAGNYRLAVFNGVGQWNAEDPFNIELDPSKLAKVKFYWKGESQHYFADGDRPLKVGDKMLTGKTHMPVPTKFMWMADNNSGLGNQKWAYNVMFNVLPNVECVVTNDWWWSLSCEYSDIILGVDAWDENRFWDISGSCTNPFFLVWPRTKQKRLFDTKNDIETYALVAKRLSELTGDKRFKEYWHFVFEEKPEVYIQRIINASSNLKGYKIEEVAAKAEQGIPSLVMTRFYPKFIGYDQTVDGKPWYTKTGRLEFYREEDTFINVGENLIVHREAIDSTPYEPNTIVIAKKHPLLRPLDPKSYGLSSEEMLKDTELRQARAVFISPAKLKDTKHPLRVSFGATHIVHTPKFRHTTHSATGDVDIVALLFGPYGDMYRHDKRTPYVVDAFIEINTHDLQKLGINDGDYVWVDADPQDRPFIGWQNKPEEYEVARLLLRVRGSFSTPPGLAKIWFNMYGSSHGSVKGTKVNKNGLAENPVTGYQSFYRRGSQQSVTRGWLNPTLMGDTLVRKDLFGQTLNKGFMLDVYCPTGAPREGFAKITKAENGGIGNVGLWRPLSIGFRPQNPNKYFKKYLEAGYVIFV
ncbi:molybdopterin oxidoreductase [Hydrogenobaculum sp. Y04AAS1]|uniref:molybdopterin-dependent oxidoreductase n=1 Tax=Hydrogenobaculum sp. (strain Y04AAS1) TaxID=380749 RepID=UPI00015BCA21|nr:molybdopterin oxidoreductase [Hydrogenobaculum sp. Y04AAS1]HCT66573.1 molybdopterin oxidoreductase [Hydrogenobaculum sp.]